MDQTQVPVPNASDGADIRALRTYAGDVAEALQNQKTSKVDIASAEKRREALTNALRSKKSAPPRVVAPIAPPPPIKETIAPRELFFMSKEMTETPTMPPRPLPPPPPTPVEIPQSQPVFTPREEQVFPRVPTPPPPPPPAFALPAVEQPSVGISFGNEMTEEQEGNRKRLILGAGIAVAVIVLGVAGYYFLPALLKAPPTVVEKLHIVPLIPVQNSVGLDVDTLTRDKLQSAIRTSAPGITNIYFTKQNGAGIEVASTTLFLEKVMSRMPSGLSRMIAPTFMLGTDLGEPFLILRAESHEYAVSGMLEWEPYMQDDLLMQTFLKGVEVASLFKDYIAGKIDTRALMNKKDGMVALLYAFLDKTTIIITTNKLTLEKVKASYVSAK